MALPAVRPVTAGFTPANGGDPAAIAAARVAEQLRSLIRDGDIDPVADRTRVAALAAELVSADQQLTGSTERPAETSRSVRNLVESVSGFGPLQPYLDDPTVEELWINGRLTGGFRCGLGDCCSRVPPLSDGLAGA